MVGRLQLPGLAVPSSAADDADMTEMTAHQDVDMIVDATIRQSAYR
jgi:hypothetical protein